MRIIVPFVELSGYIAEHYDKEVMLSYVNSHEICVSTSVNALFLSKSIGINVSLLGVVDNDVKIEYKGGFGTDIIVKGVLKFLSINMSAYNQIVEEYRGNILLIHISKVEQMKKVFEHCRLDNIIFDRDCVVINTSLR